VDRMTAQRRIDGDCAAVEHTSLYGASDITKNGVKGFVGHCKWTGPDFISTRQTSVV